MGTDPGIINWFKEQLSSHFTVTITIKSSVDSSLGMQLSHNISSRTISLTQPGYLINLMTRFGIDTSSSTTFPASPMSQLDLQDPLPVPLTPSQQKNYAISWFHIISIDSIPSRSILFGQLSLSKC